jgi:tetratricopeptide (TPR) repeat protein
MATNTIENIYIHYRTTSEFSSDAVIDFFTRNSILFNNLTKFTDKEELKLYAELMCQNLNALYHKGRYSEIVATAEKNIRFVNTKIVRLNLVAFINEWYSGILFLKAMALYKLKNYKVSTKIFRQLTNEDKRNENYKNIG